jgi:hypothetical protein
MRNPLLCRAARPESGREVRERFLMAPLARIQGERRRRLALATGLGFSAPTLGYVERIYRQGTKLLADIKDVPRRFAELVKAGSYKRVSAEVFWDYTKNGKKYPRVLKAVSFLGADIPAITDLKAVEALFQRKNDPLKDDDDGPMFTLDEDRNVVRFG